MRQKLRSLDTYRFSGQSNKVAKISQSKCKQDIEKLEHTTKKYSQAYLFYFFHSATAVFDASANVFVCFHTGKRLIYNKPSKLSDVSQYM